MVDEVEHNELQMFVSSTLTAIMNGISDAQPAAKVRGTWDNGEYNFSAPQSVTFDVAVTAKQAGAANGGFKIQVFSLGANAGGEVSSESSTVSRIQFTVPTKFKKDR